VGGPKGLMSAGLGKQKRAGSVSAMPYPGLDGEQGFTLIEVLVTVLVLALGLLGMAGLQSLGIRNTHSAYLLSQATAEAYNILDCIRANRTAAEAGAYNISLGSTPSGASLAAGDLANWKARLANVLPSGQGSPRTQAQ